METWELAGREAIRDLVARYNANGDTGRFAAVLELFAPDAVMELDHGVYTGHDEILRIFTGVRERDTGADQPAYIRHMTGTHQIDIVDPSTARGRCYFQVLTAIGLDHWGRYIDEYTRVGERWLFARRRATVDGRSAASFFRPGLAGDR